MDPLEIGTEKKKLQKNREQLKKSLILLIVVLFYTRLGTNSKQIRE